MLRASGRAKCRTARALSTALRALFNASSKLGEAQVATARSGAKHGTRLHEAIVQGIHLLCWKLSPGKMSCCIFSNLLNAK